MDGDGDSRQKIAENRPVRLKPQFSRAKPAVLLNKMTSTIVMIVTTALLRKYRSNPPFFIALI